MEAGDTVEMLSNLSKDLLVLPKPRLGTVVAVNGAYILVKPHQRDYEVDFLDNEVKIFS